MTERGNTAQMIEGLSNGVLPLAGQTPQVVGGTRRNAFDAKWGCTGHSPNSSRNSVQPMPCPSPNSASPCSTPAITIGSALMLAVAFHVSITSVTDDQSASRWLRLTASSSSVRNAAISSAPICCSQAKLRGGANMDICPLALDKDSFPMITCSLVWEVMLCHPLSFECERYPPGCRCAPLIRTQDPTPLPI